MIRRLMLISCSSKKSSGFGDLPAIDRYQGGTYKVIRKAMREGYWPSNTSVFIVSAKYGLISEHTPIQLYDQKMTRVRALELQSMVSSSLDALLEDMRYDQIFLNMGETYMISLAASIEIGQARQLGTLYEVLGGIGLRLKQTKAWLMAQSSLDLESVLG